MSVHLVNPGHVLRRGVITRRWRFVLAAAARLPVHASAAPNA